MSVSCSIAYFPLLCENFLDRTLQDVLQRLSKTRGECYAGAATTVAPDLENTHCYMERIECGINLILGHTCVTMLAG